MNFTVEFSNKHTQPFGINGEMIDTYQSKLVCKVVDDLLGIESKQTYYLWGNKQLSGSLEIDIDKYNVVSKNVTLQTSEGDKEVTLKQIVGPKQS